MKRFLCAALSLSLTAGLLSGCGSSEGTQGGNVPMGRYIEEQTGSLPGVERVRGTCLREDGVLVTYGYSKTEQWAKRYEISQDGRVQETDVAWLSGLMAAGNSVLGINETSNGALFALYMDQAGTPHLVRAEGDTPQDIEIPDWEKKAGGGGEGAGITVSGSKNDPGVTTSDGKSGAVISDSFGGITVEGSVSVGVDGGAVGELFSFIPPTGFSVLENGDYLISYGNKGVSRYSGADGALIREYPCTAFAGSTAVYGNQLLAFDPSYSGLWLYDLDTGAKSECVFDGLDYATVPNLDGEGVFLTNSGGIYRQAEGGTLWEKLVDGELTSLSMPDLSIAATASGPEGSFWALLTGEEGVEVMRYTYSADTPTNPDTELTIAALDDNATIRQAIGEFQRRNTSVKVNFQILLEGESAATPEDVIRALNTELLNGKGPDLLVLDGLPAASYIEKGVLEDLSGLEDELEAQGLMPNLMGAYRTGGGVFALPSRFTLPVMMGRSEDVMAVRALADLAREVEERQGGSTPFLKAPDTLWGEDGAAPLYVNLFAPARQGAGVEEGALTEFFRQVSQMDAALKKHTPQNGSTSAILVTMSDGGGRAEVIDMGSFVLRNGQALFHIQELGGIYGLEQICTNLGREEGWALDSLFGQGAYTPSGAVGIVTTSRQKELAQSFVKMLLSGTVQDKYLGDGFSVVRGSLEKSVIKILDGADDMGFLSLCGSLSQPLLTDQVVTDVVLDQTRALLEGRLTPEEAAAQVVEKTQIYLSE